MQLLIFWACDINCKSPLRLRANGRNIVGQQLPTLLDVTCCVCLHFLLHVVAQSLKPVKLFSQQLPTFLLFCDRWSVAQQCWIRLHSSSNIVGATHAHYAWFTKTYGLSFPWCTAGWNIMGKKGGAVVRALAPHQCGPGLNPGVDAICGLSLLLVLSLALRGFSACSPVFPSP